MNMFNSNGLLESSQVFTRIYWIKSYPIAITATNSGWGEQVQETEIEIIQPKISEKALKRMTAIEQLEYRRRISKLGRNCAQKKNFSKEKPLN